MRATRRRTESTSEDLIPLLLHVRDAEGYSWTITAYVTPIVSARSGVRRRMSTVLRLPRPLVVRELTVVADTHLRVQLGDDPVLIRDADEGLEILREAWRSQPIRHSDLAVISSVSRTTVTRWFSGDRTPNAVSFIRVAQALGFDVLLAKRKDE